MNTYRYYQAFMSLLFWGTLILESCKSKLFFFFSLSFLILLSHKGPRYYTYKLIVLLCKYYIYCHFWSAQKEAKMLINSYDQS